MLSHRQDHANHPITREYAVINGLPENLRVVPNDAERWRAWAKAVEAYRVKRRRECDRDTRQRGIEYERCRRDPAYFIAVWGVIFEPREVEGEPPQWKPFILFPIQVQMIRWIEMVNNTSENGRGDGIVEKSRDMGATNIFCAYAVHQFIFKDVFICGFISKRFDDVDKKSSSDTIFYKLRAMLGLEDAVPPNLRLPKWIQPEGMEPHLHTDRGAIKNPEPGKTCFLIGETTTKLAGVGGRSTMRVNDEAARFDAFEDAWANQQATTDHRFALSSADLKSRSFYNMARLGEECVISPEKPGPSYLRLNWWLHPFHTNTWYQNQKARAMSDGDPHKFAREYEIDYFAGAGERVYPRFQMVNPQPVPYDPHGGPMYCFLDNGIRDPAALIYVQADPVAGMWNVVDSFEGMGGEDVMFYASVMTGVYLSGEYQYDYDSYPGIHQFMEFTGSIAQPITYIGDPAGTQRGAAGDEKSTWYQQLTLAARKISAKSIFVQTITADNARAMTTRIGAVNELLPRFRFNNNPGGARVLFALQNSIYPSAKGRRELREPMIPVHDEYSHPRTAFEYGCVWLTRMEQSRSNGKASPQRRSLAGNIVSGRQRNLFHK